MNPNRHRKKRRAKSTRRRRFSELAYAKYIHRLWLKEFPEVMKHFRDVHISAEPAPMKKWVKDAPRVLGPWEDTYAVDRARAKIVHFGIDAPHFVDLVRRRYGR